MCNTFLPCYFQYAVFKKCMCANVNVTAYLSTQIDWLKRESVKENSNYKYFKVSV